MIDPERAFGQPIVNDEGVPTAVLVEAFEVEGSIATVARWFDVTPIAVRTAIKFEEQLEIKKAA